MNAPLNFGLIGYGLFGAHHANAIAHTEGARLAAICVRTEASQKLAKETHPAVDVIGDVEELLQREDLDVINVVTPNATHHDFARRALMAGKHVLLEKPMALEAAHCDELVALARQQGKVLAVGHELRLSSLWAGVKDLINDGAIGEVRHALIELSRFPYRPGSESWRYDIDRVGNWVLEEPIHFFDLARWYFSDCGEPESVYARATSRHVDHPELQDNFSAMVNFPGGGAAVIYQTLAAFGHHQTAKISGTKGTIWAHWSAADARSDAPVFGLRYGLGDDVETVQFSKPTGELLELADQIAAIVDSIHKDQPPPCTAVDGSWSTRLCLAAQRSVDEARIVDLNEF